MLKISKQTRSGIIICLNIFLVTAISVLSMRIYDIWFEARPVKESLQPATGDNGKPKRLVKKRQMEEAAFETIVSNNLFSPKRTEYVVEAVPKSKPQSKAETPPPPESEIQTLQDKSVILYGLIIMNQYQAALIEDPYEKNAAEKVKLLQPGDSLGDYKLDKVENDRIILAKQDNRFAVGLYDRENEMRSVKRGKSEFTPTILRTEGSSPSLKDKPSKANPPEARTPAPAASSESQSAQQDEYEIKSLPFGGTIRVKKR